MEGGRKSASKVERRVTVVQLARFGDLVQTSPLLQNLKTEAIELTLLVDDRTASFAKQLAGVDRVVGIDLKHLPVPLADRSLIENMRSIQAWSEGWREAVQADEVLLLNQGELPSWIAHSVRSKSISGPLHGKPLPPPHLYLNGALKNRRFNPIHLSEIWAGYGPARFPLSPPAIKRSVGTGFAKQDGKLARTPDKEPTFAVNFGAGAAGRRPRSVKVAELIRALLQQGAKRVDLLGSPEDVAQSWRIMESLPVGERRIRNLSGKTTFEQLPTVLDESNVLISADTGTLQLAAATSCRPLGLFFGGANPVETGPYCQDAVALAHCDSLMQDEFSSEDYLEPLSMQMVAELAMAMTVPDNDLMEFDDAFSPFDLLVARPTSLGVRYRYRKEKQRIQFGAGERWLPLLESFIFDANKAEGIPGHNPEYRGEQGSMDAASAVASKQMMPEGEFDREERQWIGHILQLFRQSGRKIILPSYIEQLENAYDE